MQKSMREQLLNVLDQIKLADEVSTEVTDPNESIDKIGETLMNTHLDRKIREGMANLIPLSDIGRLPTTAGHYAILCTMPPPTGANSNGSQDKVNGLFIWYNGTSASSIRSRVRSHLLRPLKSRVAPHAVNAIKVVPRDTEEFGEVLGNGSNFELGIDINEQRWDDYTFYVSTVETEMYSNVVERKFRDIVGIPSLIGSKVR